MLITLGAIRDKASLHEEQRKTKALKKRIIIISINFMSKLALRASSIPLGFLWKPAGMSASGVGARSNSVL